MSARPSPTPFKPYFDEALATRLNRPTRHGSTLPNEAYTDPQYHLLEQDRVFRRTWVFADFAHKLPAPGDIRPVEIAGQPIVLVRDTRSRLHAFHNVCRHRGAKLITQPQSQCRQVTCPNHAWSYDLEGKLLARPHFYGGDKHDVVHPKASSINLIEIRCETWYDWIFVNFDNRAPALSTHIEPIVSQLQGYDFTTLNFAQTLAFEVNANWKLAIENFIEPYHVFSCHPWLNQFVSMAERNPPTYDNHVLRCGYEFKKTDPARGQGLPYFPDLTEQKKRSGTWYVLFPNFAFEIFPDQVAVFIATPVGIDRCKETIALYFLGEGASADRYEAARNHVIQNWHDLNHEDIQIIERMQAGRYSDGFDGGVLSPYWDPVLQHFARLVFNAMQGVS